MRNKTSFAVHWIITLVLVSGLLWCCITSFSIEVNPTVVFASTILFTSLFALTSGLIESKKTFLGSTLIILTVFLLMLFFSFKYVLSSANYTVNCILSEYSKFLSIPSQVTFSVTTGSNANAFFVAVSFILSFLFTLSLVRINKISIVVVLSILCLVPNFVLITTLPSLPPLLLVTASIFALYVTTFIRKNNKGQNGAVLIISTFVMLVTAVVICIFIPIENYERAEWQDKLLDYAQELTGIESGHKSYGNNSDTLNQAKQTFADNEKLDEIGPFEKKGKKVMDFFSYEIENVYLKAVAYGNYDKNEWSILSDEQLEELPENYNIFTMTQARSPETYDFQIETVNEEELIYTPYYTSVLPNGFSVVGDVFIKNNDKLKNYSIDNISSSYNDDFFTSYSSDFIRYCEFVDNNYISLPEDLKEKMLEIGIANGINLPDSEDEMDYDTKIKLINEIKHFVSNHGTYSLNTPQMPEGKDFPVWFLEESDTGYCVHYATAAAVMLRAYGIPSRYVTGFYVKAEGGEWTEVSSDNAHAWVEYFDENIGWVPLEATPASFSPSGAAEDLEISTHPITQPPTEAKTEEITTAPTSSATEAPTTPSININTKSSNVIVKNITLVIIIIAVAVISVLVRRYFIIRLRKKHFYKGRNNTRVIYIYRYIELLDRFSRNIIPDEITEIAQKAKFSRHTVENHEVTTLITYSEDKQKQLLCNSSFFKRLYLKFIIAI